MTLEELYKQNSDLQIRIADLERGGNNPWNKWSHLAHTIDAWRIFPRLFFGLYIILTWYTTTWFMALAVPLGAQSAFVSTIIGSGAAWFGLYVSTGFKK